MDQFKHVDLHARQAAGVRALPPDHIGDEHLLSAMACGAIWAVETLYQRYSRIFSAQAHQIPLGMVKGRMRLGLKHLHRLLRQMNIDEP